MQLNLSPAPEIITLKAAPLVYLEKRGPFMKNAPLAWHEFHTLAGGWADSSEIDSMVGLSRIDDQEQGDNAFIYQAGMMLKKTPDDVPRGLEQRMFAGGRYARFLMTGSYSQFAEAYPAAFSILGKAGQPIRDDFCIEKYLNTPLDTPEDELETEIFIPV